MNYQDFKKQLIPELDKKMADLGFIREKINTSTYWKNPSDDKRLAWVVCLNFSNRGNPLFEVMITPYWIPSLHKDVTFPNGIGYKGYLTPDGFGAPHTWWIKTPDEAAKSIQEVIDALSGPGLEWLQKFSTPDRLLKEYPSAKLAEDLGNYELAAKLYRENLKSSFIDLLTEKKTTHATPYDSAKEWEIEVHEGIVEEYRNVFRKICSNTSDYERELALVEMEALQGEKHQYSKDLEADSRSKWYKAQIKYCETRIDELNQKLKE